MIISNSNIAESGTLSTASGGVIDGILEPTGARMWVPDVANPSFTWSGSADNINYIAGVGPRGFTRVLITVQGGGARNIILDRNGAFFAYFETPISFTSVTIEFFGTGAMVHFALGSAFAVPNGGEQSGYQRIPNQDTRNLVSSVDRAAIPVATSIVRRPLRASLDIPNMTRGFADTTWFDFQEFALTSGFFYVLERETDEEDAYLCFQPSFDGPRAHGSTRALVRASVDFNAYHGN